MANANDSVDTVVNAVVLELSGDVFLRLALRSDPPSQALHYAMEAVAAYSLAAEAMTGQPPVQNELLYGKLRAARALESSTGKYLLEKGTEAALVQHALAYQSGNASGASLEQLRSSRQATGVTLSELVNLRQPPDSEHDIAAIATLSLEVQENVRKLNMHFEMAQYYGNISLGDYHDYLQVLKETSEQLNAILPLYAQLLTEGPTAAARVSTLLGHWVQEFALLQGQVSDALMKP